MACLFDWQLPPEARETPVWQFLALSDWTKARPSSMAQLPNWQDWLYDDLNTLSSNLPSPCRRSAHMWSTSFSVPETRDVRLALQFTEGEEQSRAFLPRRPWWNVIRADDYRDDYNQCHHLRRRRPPEIIKKSNKICHFELKNNLRGSVHLRLVLCYWLKRSVHKASLKYFRKTNSDV